MEANLKTSIDVELFHRLPGKPFPPSHHFAPMLLRFFMRLRWPVSS